MRAGEQRILTFILSPKALPTPRKTLTTADGVMTCTIASVSGYGTGNLACPPTLVTLGFGPEWAATVTEVEWGNNGTSSTRESLVTLRPAQGPGVYASKEAGSPIRFQLRPQRIHTEQGGTLSTPPQGALILELRKEPMQLLPDLALGVTVREYFRVYHTTFYGAAPADLDQYSARPNP